MLEILSFKPKCTTKTYAMTSNVKFILPWNPVYKKAKTEINYSTTENKPFFVKGK